MSKKNRRIINADETVEAKTETNSLEREDSKNSKKSFWKGLGGIEKFGIIGLCLLLVVGVMGSGLGDSIITSFTGDSKDSTSSKNGNKSKSSEGSLLSKLNPFSSSEPPTPTNTPQLSKSYIYAGSRMLAVEDAGATSATPSDLAIWRPSSGEWWVLNGDGSHNAQQWGTLNDEPVPGDYDGDGKTDFCIFRPSNNQWWYINSSDLSTGAITFGTNGDKVAPADYDGDGRTDFAVFRPSDTNWYIWQSSTNSLVVQQFGLGTDLPTPADYDGDGKADIGVWRDSNKTFYSIKSSNTSSTSIVTFTNNSSEPVSADYDGDGRADYAIRDGADWIILNSSTGTEETINWKQSSDQAVQNDYDGDGRVDIAVWRGAESSPGAGDVGNWYIRNSADLTTRVTQWGALGDYPVPSYYRLN